MLTEPPNPQEIRPRKASFVFPRTFGGTLVSAVLAAAASLLLGSAALIVFALGIALSITAALVAYRKERYELHPTHVRCRRGGLLSDQTTELDIRNITHVKIQLPWIRHKLFGIGHVLIESAGTSQPAVLRYIREPETVYAQVRERMQSNGYDLGQRHLLHEESPALVGVILDSLAVIVATPFVIFGILGTLGPMIAAIPDDLQPGDLEALASSPSGIYVLAFAAALAAIGLFILVVRFLDLRRRTYRVYDDVVVYEEGFLTRHNAFIPYENIADAETKRTLVDQILNLYDVQISCQGSSSEIKFRRLRNGPALSAAIDDLVVRARQKPKPADRPTAPSEPGTPPPLPLAQHPKSTLVPPDQAWTAELRMNTARVLLPLLIIFPLIPLWIVLMVRGIILLSATSYAVRPSSVRTSFRFLNTEEREFTYDKVTGLIIVRNPWDKLFRTLTLQLWSIGSGKILELAHVKAASVDLPALKRQLGIPEPSPTPLENPASFNPYAFVRGRLKPLIAVAIIAALLATGAALAPDEDLRLPAYILLGVLALATLVGFIRSWVYHSRQTLTFHPTHVEAGHGVLVRHHYFACYRNIKKTVLTRHPGGDTGRLQIFVAGEQEAVRSNPGQGNSVKLRKPCSFTTDFLPALTEKQNLIDDIIAARVPAEPGAVPAEPFALVAESPRAVGNSIVKLLLLSLLPPILILLPVTLPLTIIGAKRYRYRVETGRIVVTWGILYKHHASILIDRVDSIRHNQGPLNKLFRNGTVTIMTAGSSRPDLTLTNTPNHTALYHEIRQRSSAT